MKKYLVIFFLNLSVTVFGQNCSMLKNGSYEIQYDSIKRDSSQFEVDGNKYYTIDDNGKKESDIKMLSNCSFQLENKEKVEESKLTEFQKIISKQKPYFEIIKVEGNIYYFVCRIDLHIQCGSGKFIRIEE
jgi:hypothetical protein